MPFSKKKKIQLSRRAKTIHGKRIRRSRKLRPAKLHYLRFNRPRKVKKEKKSSSYRYFQPPLSANIKHLKSRSKSIGLDQTRGRKGHCVFNIPVVFSLCDNPRESYSFIFSLFKTLLDDTATVVYIDYQDCERIDVDAQVMMDVLLKEFIDHYKLKRQFGQLPNVKSIIPRNFLRRDDIFKILCSVGTFRIFKDLSIEFPDIIAYPLCIGDKKFDGSDRDRSSAKQVHTTQLVDYVLSCLEKLNRELTPEARSNLCQVVGEILINAEEHGTTDKRYSIGYFEDKNEDGAHFGILNLVIFNFGQTIYEKFKDPACPTQHIVTRMKELSDQYTSRGWFIPASFNEETLWTLYSLQQGITSKVNYRKRGNGSIQFIDSFFNLKGASEQADSISRMVILSGNAKILFDGSYRIVSRERNGNTFKVMTFNKSGSIEDEPDKNFVTFAPNYFPGTMIIAKIKIGEDDLIPSIEHV